MLPIEKLLDTKQNSKGSDDTWKKIYNAAMY